MLNSKNLAIFSNCLDLNITDETFVGETCIYLTNYKPGLTDRKMPNAFIELLTLISTNQNTGFCIASTE